MEYPTIDDVTTSLEDARFFLEKLSQLIRGPEYECNIVIVRRYFRAYLHCWKCVLDHIRNREGFQKNKDWIARYKDWSKCLQPDDALISDYLRNTRDQDTHSGTIEVSGETAAGLFPIVMFVPGNGSGLRRELISCCERGLFVVEQLIRDHETR